jgi:hypothetical protein
VNDAANVAISCKNGLKIQRFSVIQYKDFQFEANKQVTSYGNIFTLKAPLFKNNLNSLHRET